MKNMVKKQRKKIKVKQCIVFSIALIMVFLVAGCTSNSGEVVDNTTSEEEIVVQEEQTVAEAIDEQVSSNEIETSSSIEKTEPQFIEEQSMEQAENIDSTEIMTETEEDTIVLEEVEPLESIEETVETVELDEEDELTTTQRNSINMLNYITVLTQEINVSEGSRIYLESVQSSLLNNIYPNAVDTKTQQQINNLWKTIDEYRMISAKRERLEYIYEQNKAQALRQAIPNPLGLMSTVQSKNILKTAVSVLYMAVDSHTSYQNATNQVDMKYLEDNWELDDAEDKELSESQLNLLNYMINMVRDNDFPGEFALNEDSVTNFVKWANEDNLVRKIAWLESNEETYKEFRTYWLELAKSYYNSEDYDKCLEAINQYEVVATRIFRKDYDYAEILPMAIISAKETMNEKEYIEIADKYAGLILDNCDEDDWALRYFVAQIYMDLYVNAEEDEYLETAYDIAFDNVNILVSEQEELNNAYLADIQEIEAADDDSKREKEEVKKYNKLLKEKRKVELPPVSEAFYLNCDLLFALADELNISYSEKKDIDYILHEDGKSIFLTKALDDRFWFYNSSEAISTGDIEIEFNGEEMILPAMCITDRSVITVLVSGEDGQIVLDDWIVEKVERPKNGDCSAFRVTLTSEQGKKTKYQVGEEITISVIPIAETPEEIMEFTYDVVEKKTLGVFKGIEFERTAK